MATATITVVEAPACHHCTDAQEALQQLSAVFPMEVERVPVDSSHGQELLAKHRPTMFPLVLLDGAFFSQGRLPRRKLGARLTARVPAIPR